MRQVLVYCAIVTGTAEVASLLTAKHGLHSQ